MTPARRRIAALLVAIAVALTAGSVLARFTDVPASSANTFTTDTLAPPTGLSASGGVTITLNWTATVDTYASGYRILRSTTSGSGYAQIAQVTPRTTVTHIDSPTAGTYYYVLRAYYQNWESANSTEVSAAAATNTGFRSCTANAAVTTNSGDNNGFQLNPGSACADDAAFAEDTNGGTANSSVCTSTARDRHIYYNYGFSVPAGATIIGIEVRADAWADSVSNSPQLCAELSWDGGTTWTAAKTTPNLTASEATYILGSASDTWGRTWSNAEFSNATFRVRVTGVAASTSRDFRLDWLAVKVTYVP